MNRNVYSVTQVNGYIKRLLENDVFLQSLYIEGEISNFKPHTSGHFYFTLKDKGAAISAVMFRSSAESLKFMPENGMKVVVYGRVSLYEKTGNYQIYVNSMEPAGKGALYLAFEQLKGRLEKLGYFDPKHKKPIPAYPKCVAVITSPTGAAVRDIIQICARRSPDVEIVVVPTLVQGENAAPDIVNSLKLVNEWAGCDTIILGRGGGSIEDLWAFNEEMVARAIFESKIPIISAVGHETDFTIADFMADMRAPTPSAAAELAVPEKKSFRETIKGYQNRLDILMNKRLGESRLSLESLNRLDMLMNKRLREARLSLESLNRLDMLMNKRLRESRLSLDRILRANMFRYPLEEINNNEIYLFELYKRMERCVNNTVDKSGLKLKALIEGVERLSPLKLMEKGYSLTYKGEGLVKSVNDLNSGDDVTIRLSDGAVKARVE